MKKIYAYSKVLFVALMAMMALTSCDEDAAIAYDLEGVWQGVITGEYYYDRYGSNDYDTEICFYQKGSWYNGGEGYEIDRNMRSGRFTKNYFRWSVRNRQILLEYDDGYDVIIRDFETYWLRNHMRFKGFFDDARTGEPLASFNLIKVESSDDYYDGYYSRQQAADFSDE